MVSDGIWVDQRSELVLVGEWMPVTIIRFSDHRQNKVEIPNSGGWWNVICGNDLDNDGDMDFLVGNTGRNLELSASSTDPIELYVKDFDGNAVLDPIIAYTKNGRKWVYPGLDELITQMPPIRQVFGNYRIFAQNEFNEIFPKSQLHNCYKASVQTLSSVLIENKEGNYKIHDLPLMSQISPIYGFAVKDFDDDGCKDVLAVGNVYENQPRIGKFDASFGTFLRGKGNLTFEYVEPMKSGFALGGEARDIKIISAHDNSDLMLISRNGMSLCLFK